MPSIHLKLIAIVADDERFAGASEFDVEAFRHADEFAAFACGAALRAGFFPDANAVLSAIGAITPSLVMARIPAGHDIGG